MLVPAPVVVVVPGFISEVPGGVVIEVPTPGVEPGESPVPVVAVPVLLVVPLALVVPERVLLPGVVPVAAAAAVPV